ncbi:hypothetical protein D3C73_1668330 [compost metagenome]
MSDPPVGIPVLEVKEPGFPGIQLKPAALVRTVNVRVSLVHDNLVLIRPIYMT